MIDLLRSGLVPVALDQACQRRQGDVEGEFYRRIAGQGPRSDFQATTQGFYVATAAGRLLWYGNNRDGELVERQVREKLEEFERSGEAGLAVAPLEAGALDPRWNPRLPEGGRVVRVRAKVMSGYQPTDDPWRRIFQSALSRDNLWITGPEHEALARGEFPEVLVRRLARFHLVDNTRGEPPMWEPGEVVSAEVKFDQGVVTGRVRLRTADGQRSYDAWLRGQVAAEGGVVTRFDLVACGEFSGGGPFTPDPPPGGFSLAISFSLADGGEVADAIPPQGARGWLEGYLKAGGQ